MVENTHQPLVSREDFQQVQALIKARPSPSTFEVENIFRGILFCSECRRRLSLAHKEPKYGGDAYYRCMHHYQRPEECHHTHAIYYNDLYKVALNKIRETAHLLQDNSAFLDMVNRRAELDTPNGHSAETKAKLEKRQSELSRLLRKLFEDNAAGLVNDENYAVMFKAYQDKQAEVIEKLRGI